MPCWAFEDLSILISHGWTSAPLSKIFTLFTFNGDVAVRKYARRIPYMV